MKRLHHSSWLVAIQRVPPVTWLGLTLVVAVLCWQFAVKDVRVVKRDLDLDRRVKRLEGEVRLKLQHLSEGLVTELKRTDTIVEGYAERSEMDEASWLLERLEAVESLSLVKVSADDKIEQFILTGNQNEFERVGFLPRENRFYWGDKLEVELSSGWVQVSQKFISYQRSWSEGVGGDRWISCYLFSRVELQRYLDDYLQQWFQQSLANLRIEGAGYRLVGSQELRSLLPSGGRNADRLVNLSSPLANWQLHLWYPMETERRYEPVLLLLGSLFTLIFFSFFIAGGIWRARERRTAIEQTTFLNRVTHDLRTPLTNMLLTIDLTEEEIEDRVQSVERLKTLKDDVKQLNHLIENALDYSRGVRQQSLESVNPAEYINDVLASFSASFRQREIELECEGLDGLPSSLTFHTDVVKRVLYNVLDNACKHGGRGKWVGVNVWLQGLMLHVTVADRGVGIGSGGLENLLEKAKATRTSLTDTGGSGLGLLITQELLAAVNGEIRLLESTQGTKFELMFPVEMEDRS